MILQSGTFLKAVEVKNGDIITILDAGAVSESQTFTTELKDGRKIPKKDYIFKISYKGADKIISMNKVSRDNLSAMYTNNTDAWVGKKASIEICLFSNGKRGIVLSPIVDISEEHEKEDTETPF